MIQMGREQLFEIWQIYNIFMLLLSSSDFVSYVFKFISTLIINM